MNAILYHASYHFAQVPTISSRIGHPTTSQDTLIETGIKQQKEIENYT